MTIALLGWARLSSQAVEGSGYNLNASELARGLVLRGHRVLYLSSGMTYSLGLRGHPGGRGVGGARLRAREDWAGIRCFEVVNSPVLSPAACNFGSLEPELRCPEVTRLVLEWLATERVEVVHVHALEGFGMDLIPAIRSAGLPVIVTPHNYHYACPQVDLLFQEREVCVDYAGGEKCTRCISRDRPMGMARRRAFGQTLERALGMYPADVVRKAIYGTPAFLKRLAKGGVRPWPRMHPIMPDHHDDPETQVGGIRAMEAGRDGANPDASLTDAPPYARSDRGMNEQVIANTHHLTVLESNPDAARFAARRRAGLEALKSATLVTPPSDFVRRVYVSMGVPEAQTRWVRLGQPHFDTINRRARRSPFYDQRPWDPSGATRPVRFAYFGTTRANKGLEVFARAIVRIAPELRARAQFIVHASGDDGAYRRRLRHIPNVTVWGWYDLNQLAASHGEYDVGVMSHIWLENSPLVLLEHLHAGKFVIGPRLGGMADFVSEPGGGRGSLGNGLLFPGGDEQALGECLGRVIAGEVIVPSPREVHEASALRTYAEHLADVESVYADSLVQTPARRG